MIQEEGPHPMFEGGSQSSCWRAEKRAKIVELVYKGDRERTHLLARPGAPIGGIERL
jgi:hypothetical protein